MDTQNLFTHSQNQDLSFTPLAHRMRPEHLTDFVGQERVVGLHTPLRRWIETDQVPSLILWGPPGTGKTTLAQIVAKSTSAFFESLSAIEVGVPGLKQAAERARNRRAYERKKTIVFIDEIHRFTKAQQDVLLPYIEDGSFTLIGATTENPSFELNRALLSRLKVIKLSPLTEDSIRAILDRALDSPLNPGFNLGFSPEARFALTHRLASSSQGDARNALTRLESFLSFLSTPRHASKIPLSNPLTLSDFETVWLEAESVIATTPVAYDKNKEEHHNVVSAFIKSMRASDPNAALYYLARMIEGGEDPLFIARRLVIFASEDVGLADFRALLVANAAKEAVEFVGWPEARINLAHATVVLAQAKKDRSAYQAIAAALAEVQETGGLQVPNHLRNVKAPDLKTETHSGRSNLPVGVRNDSFLGR